MFEYIKYEETYEDEEEVEEEPEEIYQADEYEEPKKRVKLSETKRKILTFSIIIIVSFATGCALVGISMYTSENSARNDLANNDLYLATIIDSFSITVYNSIADGFTSYNYLYNSNTSTFDAAIGDVDYIDEQENMEYMLISIAPSAPELTIQKITFSVNEKSQLNIIIFADGKEVFNAMKIKNDIALVFLLFVSEISVYVF
ncbi:MAG: hypothetical protein ACTSQN_06640 [Candidatus Heimdallarchaeota archaeon]